jgi:hypothetical protein
MEPTEKPAAGGEAPQEKRVPNTDMQPEDSGTEESKGEQSDAGRGTAAEGAMKQTSKTEQESGDRR